MDCNPPGSTEIYITDEYDHICKKTRYAYDYACDKGTYNRFEQKTSSTDCLVCPQGFYCPGPGYGNSPISCQAGYYCQAGAIVGSNEDKLTLDPLLAKTMPCPAGSYCPTGSSTPTLCPSGKYCPIERLNNFAGDCEAGYICTSGSNTARPTGAGSTSTMGYICPKGYYCERGATDKKPCPAGTYLNSLGGKTLSDCLKCPAGYYCSTSGLTMYSSLCQAGFFCPEGTTTAAPAANYCPAGHKCPQGSMAPVKCDPDKYQTEIKSIDCSLCPVAFYCQDGTKKIPCPAGAYCESGNKIKNCPVGQYRSDTGGSVPGDCLPCTAGLVCETPGTISPSIKCAAGYYCMTGSSTRFPSGVNGNICDVGYYCPEGSAAMVKCPGGEYCAFKGLAAPTDKCQAGYYCPENSLANKGTFLQCSAGYFCPKGSAKETPCPIGTYGPNQGADSISDCIPCDLGKYCDVEGMSSPLSKPCLVGYYCPPSQITEDPESYVCPKGYMCPTASAAPTPCPPGSYQMQTKQGTCNPCPVGYYCDGDDGSQTVECPRGYYCPQGTALPSEHPCPPGTYNTNTKGTLSTDCLSCPAGYYCPERGQLNYQDLCAVGYYCKKGAKYPNPQDGITGYACSSGYYCPEGTQTEVPCPQGTFFDGRGAQDYTDCQNVPPGKFSSLTGATSSQFGGFLNPTANYGPCKQGFVCTGGAASSSPVGTSSGYVCPKGSYCPPGSAFELLCPLGTYNPLKEQARCADCPLGKYCDKLGTETPSSCLQFYYCVLGTADPKPCPPGTLSSVTDATAPGDCSPCSAGFACELPATTSSNLRCADGYYCSGGSAYEYPMEGIQGELNGLGSIIDNGFCPPGSYCKAIDGRSTQCPIGTFQDAKGTSDCKPCPAGYACTGIGLSSISHLTPCAEGYYCSGGASTIKPPTGVCSINHYCEQGSTYEAYCLDGMYQPDTGQGICKPCPEGEICYIKFDTSLLTQTHTMSDCPEYYYCEPGSGITGKLCGLGTRGEAGIKGWKTLTDCTPCPNSKYCVDAGKGGITPDPCAAGYFCVSGAKSPTPSYCPPSTTCNSPYYPPYESAAPEIAYLCPPGFYCGTGVQDPTQCPSGTFRADPGAMIQAHCSDCLPGQYCVKGNPIPFKCPKGSYCPPGSKINQKCPIGKYNTIEESKYPYECLLCPAGNYCNEIGVSNLAMYPCPASSYCPIGAVAPVLCLAGLYISSGGGDSSACKGCSVNYYCPSGTAIEHICPDGYECPAYSPAPAPCEAGFCCHW